MHIVQETLDDLLRELYPRLIDSPIRVVTSRGPTREILGTHLELRCPRARLSRTETRGKPFSCLGELLWYFSGENKLDFITYYLPRYAQDSDDGVTIYGGYGPRLFRQRGHDQFANVQKLLSRHPTSRRAVIQLFDAEDIAQHRVEVPCTTTLQFVVRDGKLHMLTTMRSNDAYIGLPHDVFCFTMMQEMMARSLGHQLGIYHHFVGSMHVYECNVASVQTYVEEGVQPRIEMPSMPTGDPWPSIKSLLDAERRLRSSETIDVASYALDPYWADLVRLLQVLASGHDANRIEAIKAAIVFKRYGTYIRDRIR